jgi:hypothetical protein
MSDFTVKSMHALLTCRIYGACLANLSLTDMITLTFGRVQIMKLVSMHVCRVYNEDVAIHTEQSN